MSMFENDQYRWRETYFVVFQSSKRPTLETLQQRLSKLNSRFTLTNLSADESGRFESMTVLSPDDFAALDVCYLEGPEVRDRGAELARRLPRCGGHEYPHHNDHRVCDDRHQDRWLAKEYGR